MEVLGRRWACAWTWGTCRGVATTIGTGTGCPLILMIYELVVSDDQGLPESDHQIRACRSFSNQAVQHGSCGQQEVPRRLPNWSAIAALPFFSFLGQYEITKFCRQVYFSITLDLLVQSRWNWWQHVAALLTLWSLHWPHHWDLIAALFEILHQQVSQFPLP